MIHLLYGKAFIAVLSTRVIAELIMIPIQIIVIYFINPFLIKYYNQFLINDDQRYEMIELTNVTYKYKNNNNLVLDNITLKINTRRIYQYYWKKWFWKINTCKTNFWNNKTFKRRYIS